MKPGRKKNPALAAAWDAYGHSIAWEDLFDAKFRGDGGYVALAWMEGDEVNYADLALAPDWDMQNDGHDPVPLALWRRAKVDPYCDRVNFPGDER